jgi:TPR repeat protein
MEKSLTKDELLISLISQAMNPFYTMEQKWMVKRVLAQSTTLHGRNHLFLISCYLSDTPLFHVSREEAIKQAHMALKEGNEAAYYYLFYLLKEENPSMARNYLRLACEKGYPKAHLEIAKQYHYGLIFEKNRKKAFHHYEIAAKCGLEDGYFGMLLMASEDKDIVKERNIYLSALIRGISLPGVVE